MTRERSFRRRGQPFPLLEIDDWYAVPRPHQSSPRGAAPASPEAAGAAGPLSKGDPPRKFSEVLPELIDSVNPDDLLWLDAAGWTLVPRAVGREADDDPVRSRLFVTPGGNVVLGTRTLTVQLKNDQPQAQTDEMLAQHGTRVLQKLTFAPRLYQVILTENARADTIDVANALERSGMVVFAEPDLIEVLGPR